MKLVIISVTQELKIDISSSPAGGHLLVLTDGEENVSPYIADVEDEVISNGVIVDSILYTSGAAGNDLPNLSAKTGGDTFYDDGTPESTQLIRGFLETITSNQSPGECNSVVQVSFWHRKMLENQKGYKYTHISER